ncbi:PTS system fructose-specific EIIABC component [Phycisphaerae bacterium RAS2]|nr:PTS system fructose-specific EIIABC component [Phycisphaerae bacterium RAS2]
MKLTEHLTPALIKVPLVAKDKKSAIAEMVDVLVQGGITEARDTLLAAVMERENQRTTGIGLGFAIPHAKTDAVKGLIIALGRTAQPIDFAAIDGKPVNLIALLVSPSNATSQHIQALARLSRMVTSASLLQKLLDAPDAQALYDLIAASDNAA